MSQLNAAAEAAKVLTRQIEAFATVGKALEGIASLEAAVNEAEARAKRIVSAADEENVKLVKLRAQLFDAEKKLEATAGEAEKIKAEALKFVSDAKAEASLVVKTAQENAGKIVADAKAEAGKIVADAKVDAAKVADDARSAQAEVDRLNGIIAEARAKLGV
jgi:vacuolar-type H+-ATPase subunit H